MNEASENLNDVQITLTSHDKIKRRPFTKEEDELIITLVKLYNYKWSLILKRLTQKILME